MLQAYSNNIDVAANSAVPFNNVTIDKGCAETLSGPGTIDLNKRGVYLVKMDGYAMGDTANELVSLQLYVNGVAQPQAISAFTASAVNVASSLSFACLVQVAENNCCCNCTSAPTSLQIRTGDTAIAEAHVNVLVTKLV